MLHFKYDFVQKKEKDSKQRLALVITKSLAKSVANSAKAVDANISFYTDNKIFIIAKDTPPTPKWNTGIHAGRMIVQF